MTREQYVKIAERSAWTFVQAAGAVLIVQQQLTWLVLKAAAVAGALAVVKGLAAVRVGKTGEPSLP